MNNILTLHLQFSIFYIKISRVAKMFKAMSIKMRSVRIIKTKIDNMVK